ncbi:MAG: OmpA family protein [Planctomycetota bacterium]|nr:OmpA family protein [Planctomycetota bacterium]
MRMINLGLAALFVLGALGCQNKMDEQNQGLYEQNKELQVQLDQARSRQTASTADPAAVATLKQQLADRDAMIAQLRSDSARPAASPQPGMNGVDTTYDAQSGTLTATVPGDVLFDAGTATLKESAKVSLSKIVSAIQTQYPDKLVFVDGHTDSDPIAHTKSQWADNRDLSYARAKAVATYLSTSGVDQKRITIRAFGENQPKATKPASRRVEIVVELR